jgi:hypothetical protein
MALPTTIQEADVAAVKAYRWAAKCGSAPHPDSPIGRAAARAAERQEQLHPHTDFVAKALEPDEPGKDIREHAAETSQGRRVDREAADHRLIPQNDAVGITRRSLAGVGAVNLAGAGASTIGTDQQPDRFLAKLQDAERARQIMADPATPEAMKRAMESAGKKGRKPTAEDFSKSLAEVKAEQGPTPPRPPEPVVQLFAQSTSAAKSTVSSSFSPIPDRFRR